MAEGGGDFGFHDTELDRAIDNDDMPDEQDTTRPFRPQAASTPYHGGEQFEMQTMIDEQSGLPSYDETTPLLPPDINTELSRRLAKLRENCETGLLDISDIPKLPVNPLGEEFKEEQIRRLKKFMKLKYPLSEPDKLVISYSKNNPMALVVLGPRGGETKIVLANGSDF